MKQKDEKNKKENVSSKNQGQSGRPVLIAMDATYQKINKISFHQNFKSLIGHYKGDGPSSRIGSFPKSP
jgi:hypothetical protein